jgi:hypothetical protein
MRCVKALGLPLESRSLAQVSMNLTDFDTTPMHRVFEAVRDLAAREGTAIAGSELIGMVPRRAIESAGGNLLAIAGFHPGMVLENRIAEALPPNPLEEFMEGLGDASAAAASGAMSASLIEGAEVRRRFFARAAQRLKTAPDGETELHEWARLLADVAEEAHALAAGLANPAALALARAAADASAAALREALPRMLDREVAAALGERLERL